MHRCLEGSWSGVDELSPLLLGSAFSNLLRARVFQDTARHDDELFPAAIGLLRPRSPLLAAFAGSIWGFVAFADGEHELASSLAEEFFQARRPKELVRPVRRDNSVLGALIAACRTTDADQLRRLGEGIEDAVAEREARGQHTEATLARLVVAGIYERGGWTDLAAPHRASVSALRRTFDDAPFIDRFDAAVTAMSSAVSPRAAARVEDLLTPRQQVVARHLASGLSVEEIAAQLFISRHTLRTHLREIYRRLGVRSRHEAVLRLTDARVTR
jgi:DNA-binding CsgD family transcriptional regulator